MNAGGEGVNKVEEQADNQGYSLSGGNFFQSARSTIIGEGGNCGRNWSWNWQQLVLLVRSVVKWVCVERIGRGRRVGVFLVFRLTLCM